VSDITGTKFTRREVERTKDGCLEPIGLKGNQDGYIRILTGSRSNNTRSSKV
jgi:hypothetical protein